MHFNSRPHGGRLPLPPLLEFFRVISTHALTEGDSVFCHVFSQFSFQLTPSRRATASVVPARLRISFQLTPSRRATSSSFSELFCKEFQLTPSRRATTKNLAFCEPTYISTHALTEGDYIIRIRFSENRISTHALTEGDFNGADQDDRHFISTHALTEGDGRRLSEIYPVDISTHALTEGDL